MELFEVVHCEGCSVETVVAAVVGFVALTADEQSAAAAGVDLVWTLDLAALRC